MATPSAHGAPTGRLDREQFFLAAYDLLGEEGWAAVTVPALCERLRVTKGSFYHHFTDLPAFVAAFAKRWQAWLDALIDAYHAEPDLLRRVELMTNSHGSAMTGAEPIIRAWSRTEPALAEAIREVDRRGVEIGHLTFGALCGDDETGALLGRMISRALVGMQQRARPMEPDRFVRIVAEWFRCCLHLEIQEIRVGGRLCVRVLGQSDVPIPPLRRPETLPAAGPASEAVFDAGIQAAVDAMTPTATGRRGREAYFQAAREILADRGPDGVTVANLCARLGVTKGSFHHHFATTSGFVEALAEHWAASFLGVQEAMAADPDPVRRLEALYQGSLSLPHPAEATWRAWGWTDPVVADALRRVEERGQILTTQVLTELLGDPDRADLLAELGIGLTIGLQQADPPLDAETFALTALEWVRRCVGLDAHLVVVDGVPCLRISRSE